MTADRTARGLGRWRAAPYTLGDAECFAGVAGSTAPCDDVRQAEPGHVTATTGVLGAGQGASLEVALGGPLTARPATPSAPSEDVTANTDRRQRPAPPTTAPQAVGSGGTDWVTITLPVAIGLVAAPVVLAGVAWAVGRRGR